MTFLLVSERLLRKKATPYDRLSLEEGNIFPIRYCLLRTHDLSHGSGQKDQIGIIKFFKSIEIKFSVLYIPFKRHL